MQAKEVLKGKSWWSDNVSLRSQRMFSPNFKYLPKDPTLSWADGQTASP